MGTTEQPVPGEQASPDSPINQSGIDNHKKAANHLESAAQHHLDAAKHYENGDNEKAAQSTLAAQGSMNIAIETQKEIVSSHALKS